MLERREVEEQWRISRKSELSRLNEVEGKTEEGGGEGKQVAEAERRKCQFIFRNLSFVLIGNTTRKGAAKKKPRSERTSDENSFAFSSSLTIRWQSHFILHFTREQDE